MKLVVMGAGYVGLVSAACLAELGHQVACLDPDQAKIAALAGGRLPVHEPGLDGLIAANRTRLAFATEADDVLSTAEVVMLAVGTPARADGRADVSQVVGALEAIAASLSPGAVLAVKSTVPVGTGDDLERRLARLRGAGDVAVAANPEFLRAGAAVGDFMAPERIVLGVEDQRAREVLERLYAPFAKRSVPLLITDRRTAEVLKYAANAFLAAKVGLINEIADLCEATGADVTEVARGLGLDRRIGPSGLDAGPGFGGSCLPKDALALIASARDHGVGLPIIAQVVQANVARKRALAGKVVAALGGSAGGTTVAVLGLAFKPGTDDVRESPALDLIEALARQGAAIRAHDPEAMAQARLAIEAEVVYCADAYECAQGADAAVIVTAWPTFAQLDLDRLKAALARPVLVDLRNQLDPCAVAAKGFAYHPLGRPRPKQEACVPGPDGPYSRQ